MSNPTLQAEQRSDTGKGVARKLRAAGRMPAVAYGGSAAAQNLTINPEQILGLKRGPLGWNQPVSIDVDGGDNVELAMLQAVDKHPITGQLLHADFVRVDAKQAVVVAVPLRVEGTAPGVAMGGRLNQQLRALKVSCLPSDIPEGIAVDVSKLNIGDRVLLSEVVLPSGVTALIDDQPLVILVGRRGARQEEEVEEAAEDAEEGASEESGE